MPMLLMEERRERILTELIRLGSVRVSDLAAEFEVTPETVRKDLIYLEERGYARKTHGGATLRQTPPETVPTTLSLENIEAKARVARRAVELVDGVSAIIVGSGSTTLELARLLALREGNTIFTDSLPAASALLASNNKVFLFGGEISNTSSSVAGSWTVSQIDQVHADLAFMGTDGFANLSGPSTATPEAAEVSRMMISHADELYVLADASKSRLAGMTQVCGWEEVDALVTESGADQATMEAIRRVTRVICCE